MSQMFMKDGRWMSAEEFNRANKREEAETAEDSNVEPLTKAQIIEELKTRGIEFKTSDSKAVLEALLAKSKTDLEPEESVNKEPENTGADANV